MISSWNKFLILSLAALYLAPLSYAQDIAIEQEGAAAEAAVDLSYVGDDLNGFITKESEADNVLTLDIVNDDAAVKKSSDSAAAVDPQALLFASVNPNNMRSLLYNEWEHGALLDAIAARSYIDVEAYKKRSLGGAVDGGTNEFGADTPAEVINSIRELSLGGILYSSKKEWTIWLNGQRVTPKSKPEEVVGLKVFEDYIELKWLDQKTLKVYPIRLRSHQRFNLDNNLFLPG